MLLGLLGVVNSKQIAVGLAVRSFGRCNPGSSADSFHRSRHSKFAGGRSVISLLRRHRHGEGDWPVSSGFFPPCKVSQKEAINLVQGQKWSFAYGKATVLELVLVYDSCQYHGFNGVTTL